MKAVKYRYGTMIIFTLFTLSIFFTGCSKEKKGKEVTITFWNLSSRKDLTEKIIEDFMAENPNIKVKAVLNSVGDHRKNLKIAASSNSLPGIWYNWGGTLASFYPENGLSYDLSEYAMNNNWDSKFDRSALDLSTLSGQLAGYPTSLAMIGVFYRKDIFDKAGVTVPSSFEEFEQVMSTLKSKGYTPLGVCGKGGWHVMRFVEALLEEYAGSELHDQLTSLNASWNNDAVIQAFSKFKEYSDLGYYPEGFVTLSGSDAKSLLYAGESVMDLEGPWAESNIYADQQDHDLYGYFKIPFGERMSGFVEMIQFNKNLSKSELEACMKFVDFFYSPASINNPEYGTLIKQPVPRSDNSLPSQFKIVPEMIEDMNKYGTYTISDQGLPQEMVGKLFEAQDAIATGLMTPEAAAEFMQTSIEDYKATL